MLDCLKFYINFVFSLFPCRNSSHKTKAPLTEHGFKDATTDLRQIETWYQQFPNCAWGTPTSSERGVFDIDTRNNGIENFNKLVAEYGPLPPTPKVITGSGGYHYWLKFPVGTSCERYPGIDRKADGGYVIVPPSRIAIPEHEGRAYTWEVRPWEMPIAEAPAWLLGLKPKAIATDANWVVHEACADLLTHPGCDKSKGEKRTPTLCQLIGVHLTRGDSPASIYAMAEAWASRCNPPLDEWQKHVDGLLAKEEAKKMTPPREPTPTGGLKVISERRRKQTNSDAQGEGELVSFSCRERNSINAKAELVSFPPVGEGNSEAQGEGELVCFLPMPAQSADEISGVIYKTESNSNMLIPNAESSSNIFIPNAPNPPPLQR